MAYGILKFKLPEEREEFELAQKACSMHVALTEFAEQMRQHKKYNNDLCERQHALLDDLRIDFYAILKERGIEL